MTLKEKKKNNVNRWQMRYTTVQLAKNKTKKNKKCFQNKQTNKHVRKQTTKPPKISSNTKSITKTKKTLKNFQIYQMLELV